jgi:hypothetical protein
MLFSSDDDLSITTLCHGRKVSDNLPVIYFALGSDGGLHSMAKLMKAAEKLLLSGFKEEIFPLFPKF